MKYALMADEICFLRPFFKAQIADTCFSMFILKVFTCLCMFTLSKDIALFIGTYFVHLSTLWVFIASFAAASA